MAPRDIPAQFRNLIPKALKSDSGHLEINKFIKNYVVDQGALLDCIWLLASSYAANQKDMKEGPRQVVLAIYYALLMHATELAGPMNELSDCVLYIDALAIQTVTGEQPKLKFNLPKTTTAQQFELYKALWLNMPEQERIELRTKAMKARTKLLAARTLTSVLSDAYEKERSRKPKLDDLFDYDPAPNTSRKQFDQAVLACDATFNQLAYKEFRTPLELRLQQLDQAFAALRRLLMAAGADQLAYFQMWKWVREKAWERSTTNQAGGHTTSIGATSGSLYYEIYLEACYCALILARSRWNMLQVQKSKGLPTADRDLLLGPLAVRERAHFEKRLELGLMTPDEDHVDFDTLTRVRRRMEGVARDQGLYHLDEFEVAELMNNLIWVRQNKPEVLEKRVIRAVSNYPALRDQFKVDQTVLDYFTIVWAEGSGKDETVIVEFHKFSLQLFRLPANRLDDLVRKALWRKMQELGAQVIAFMLAYLELLSHVADIATAGIAGGGLRGFAIAYLKDKALEKGTDVVLDELGVDNPYVRVLAHMGSGAVHMPKRKVHVDVSDAHSASKALDTGVVSDAERGLVKTGDKRVANRAVEVGYLSDGERGLAPKLDIPTGKATTQVPIVDFQKPHANDYAADTAKAAKKKPDGDVVDIGGRRQQVVEQQNATLAAQQQAQYRKLAEDQERTLQEAHRRFAEQNRLAEQQATRQTGARKAGENDIIDLSTRKQQMLQAERDNTAQLLELQASRGDIAYAGGGGSTTMGPGRHKGHRATVGHTKPARGDDRSLGKTSRATGGNKSGSRTVGVNPSKAKPPIILLPIDIHTSREGFNRQLKAFFEQHKDHALKAIYDRKNKTLHPSTEKGMGELYRFQHPEAIQAGHSTSHHTGKPEKVVIMTAFDNQILNHTIEGKGAGAAIVGGFDVAIIDGLPIKLTSAQHLVAFGKLDAEALEKAFIVNVDDL